MPKDELDVHGMKLHEAESEVLRFIDNAYFRGELSCKIVHGFGVISENLPKWIKTYPYVVGFERDPGNAGATIVKLESH